MNSLPQPDTNLTSHPGFLLFKRDCKPCHVLDDAIVVGPGLGKALQHKSRRFLTELLIGDPGRRLKSNRAYQKRAKVFGGSWHEEIKFGANLYTTKEQKRLIEFLLLLQKDREEEW